MKEKMLNYLQRKLDRVKAMEKKNEENPNYYRREEIIRRIDEMVACKEMVEAMIGEPVNLRFDGKVTVGFENE